MHNLAIALSLKGYNVTGSDDEIFEPAKGRLQKYGLLPDTIGWNPDKIDRSIDAIILGMHARLDNPELIRAKELNIKIYSYPEFLYEQSKDKTRIVIGGSHGKTTITAMIIHVLQRCNILCDYMVGAQLVGFEVMVRLSDNAPVMVIEGDEYLTSPIDLRPKFHLYKPTIGIISGIAWDHINVFPTFDVYVKQFEIFAKMISENGAYIYCYDDPVLKQMSERLKTATKIPYSTHPYFIENGITFLKTEYGDVPLQIFGKHNLANIGAAMHACCCAGVSKQDFYRAISSFKGASNRLELLGKSDHCVIYKDFAHSPSKLRATIEAVREQFPDKTLIACMELHTFSSLNKQFLDQYAGCMDKADVGYVFFNPSTVEHKKLPPVSPEIIFKSFQRNDLEVFNSSTLLKDSLLKIKELNTVFLLMSSGNFSGIDLAELTNNLLLLRR